VKVDGTFTREEVGSIYVDENERFVVSLIVGYSEDALSSTGRVTAKTAALAAVELTRDEGSSDTKWFVYDRKRRVGRFYEQGEFDQGESLFDLERGSML
jgi:hypothetical protein